MSLQGAWRFEEGSGTTSADMSGNGLTATTVPGWTASGHTGGGLALNGTTAGAAIAISSDFDFWYSFYLYVLGAVHLVWCRRASDYLWATL